MLLLRFGCLRFVYLRPSPLDRSVAPHCCISWSNALIVFNMTKNCHIQRSQTKGKITRLQTTYTNKSNIKTKRCYAVLFQYYNTLCDILQVTLIDGLVDKSLHVLAGRHSAASLHVSHTALLFWCNTASRRFYNQCIFKSSK